MGIIFGLYLSTYMLRSYNTGFIFNDWRMQRWRHWRMSTFNHQPSGRSGCLSVFWKGTLLIPMFTTTMQHHLSLFNLITNFKSGFILKLIFIYFIQANYHMALLKCVKSLYTVCAPRIASISLPLFKIIVTVQALCSQEAVARQVSPTPYVSMLLISYLFDNPDNH